MTDVERARLEVDREAWLRWGPYLAERAWGTVREDYSDNGDAWNFFPHDHARSRTYRWSEDGMGGICDDHQLLCFAWSFWNGHDPILKERLFGLSGPEGNHGEDAKEYWWNLDSTPTHSWMRWRYFYPQAAFPYADLVDENRRRGKLDGEYELLDTGVFEQGYWDITVDYAKATPDDIVMRVSARNAGAETATLDLLANVWFRNTWSWGLDDRRPRLTAKDGAIVAEHHALGRRVLSGSGSPELLFCDNESNALRLWGGQGCRYPKDGIGDHVVHGTDTVNPDAQGTKGAMRYRLFVAPGESAQLTVRLSTDGKGVGQDAVAVLEAREREADAFYSTLTPAGATAEEASVMRQAFAGMLWSKQFFHYNVARWLDGDPAAPPPPADRLSGRNHDWRHLDNAEIISMPDTWEYPWYAAWDLGFHCVALARVDARFAKEQLVLLCREWFMHPNGQLPAYEWNFSDVNPPVHAWAALRVFEIDGSHDFEFLERVFQKLLLNFTWWVNRKDAGGNNVFEGGFLGLDNIGPIDRSELPVDGILEQSDGSAWMGMYCLNLLEISLVLAAHDEAYEDMATKFFEHFALIATAIYDRGLWNEEDGFYYDILQIAGGERVPLRVRSLVGLLPLCASTTLGESTLDKLPAFARRLRWFIEHRPQFVEHIDRVHTRAGAQGRLLAIVSPERLGRMLQKMLASDEFLSPFGIRSVSQRHRDHPFSIQLGGMAASVDYEPAESAVGLFGGNSNWRGPVWFPVNYLMMEALRSYHRFFGEDYTVEMPTGSGLMMTLDKVADDIARRLVALFLEDADGRRPVHGPYERFHSDPAWHDVIPFHEYFHGDNGMGLGASHQTGWTGLVADLIAGRPPP
ncbi:MAG: glucosidase [Acidimicrobiales bacterium]